MLPRSAEVTVGEDLWRTSPDDAAWSPRELLDEGDILVLELWDEGAEVC